MENKYSLAEFRREIFSKALNTGIDSLDVLKEVAKKFPALVNDLPGLGQLTKSAITLMNIKHAYDNAKAGILLKMISDECGSDGNFRTEFLLKIAPLNGSKDAVLRALEAVQDIDDESILTSLARLAANYNNRNAPCNVFFYSMVTLLKSIHLDEFNWISQILKDHKTIEPGIETIMLYDSGPTDALQLKYLRNGQVEEGRLNYYTPSDSTRNTEEIRTNLILALRQPGIQSISSLFDDDILYAIIDTSMVLKLLPYFS